MTIEPRTTSFGPAFFFEVFRRRIGVVIVSTIVAVALTVPAIFLIKKHYKASTRILITEPVLNGNTTVQEPLLRRDQDTAQKLGNISNLIKSDLFLTKAVEKLNAEGYESSASPQWSPTAERLKDSVSATLDQPSLEIAVDTPNPDASIKLARILGEEFKEWMSRVEVRPTGETANAIKGKADQLNLEIQDLRQKLEVFKGKNGDALPDQSANYLLQREAYQSLIAKDRVDLEKLRNEYASLQNRLRSDMSLRVDTENPAAKKLQEKRAELASMMATHKDTHPLVIELQKEIKQLEDSLTATPAEGQVSLSIPYRTTDARVKEVKAQIDGYERSIPIYQRELDRLNGNLKKMPSSEQTINELSAQIRTKEQILDKLTQEQSGALLSQQILTQVQDSKYVTVSSTTQVNGEPSAKFLLMAAFAGGLTLGIILAIIFELIDPVVYGPAQLEAQSGVPLLTVIPERMLVK
jgi:uncharacterized protein involved in exopolysaccharide biosynthesis